MAWHGMAHFVCVYVCESGREREISLLPAELLELPPTENTALMRICSVEEEAPNSCKHTQSHEFE